MLITNILKKLSTPDIGWILFFKWWTEKKLPPKSLISVKTHIGSLWFHPRLQAFLELFAKKPAEQKNKTKKKLKCEQRHEIHHQGSIYICFSVLSHTKLQQVDS